MLFRSVHATEQNPARLGATNAGLAQYLDPASTFGKQAFSALGSEELREALEAAGCEHLLLAGIEVPVCLYQTAVEARRGEMDVTVLADCVSGRRAEDFPPVYDELRDAGAHLLPSETVFYSLVGSAEHPQFRAYTGLVKEYA